MNPFIPELRSLFLVLHLLPGPLSGIALLWVCELFRWYSFASVSLLALWDPFHCLAEMISFLYQTYFSRFNKTSQNSRIREDWRPSTLSLLNQLVDSILKTNAELATQTDHVVKEWYRGPEESVLLRVALLTWSLITRFQYFRTCDLPFGGVALPFASVIAEMNRDLASRWLDGFDFRENLRK